MHKIIGWLAPWFLLLWPAVAVAQLGTIAGVIVDGETGETLIGANVRIEGTTVGTASDLNGRYEFDAEPGTYRVLFSYIGYDAVTVDQAVVILGDVTRLEVQLFPEAFQVGELVVEAELMLNSEAGLLRERARSIAISDAISATTFSRSGSGDAAAAMKKVTGASVVGGKYVYIRGLGDRYANTTLNGSALPSSDPDRKAFQLDLIPTALLDNIITTKTFTPDKPGDFSGGLIDVTTTSFPEQLTMQLSFSVTYDDQATGIGNFLSYPGSSTDWLGRDDGSRALPDILAAKDPTNELPTQQDLRDVRSGVTNEIRAERADSLNAFSRAFNGVMVPEHASVPINHAFSAAIGTKTTVFGRPLGITGSLTYSRSWSFYDDGVYSRWRLSGGDVAGVDNLTSDTYFGPNPNLDLISRADPAEATSFANVRGTEAVNWGASGTVAWQPANNHQFAFTVLRTQSGASQATLLGGFRDQNSTATFLTRSLDYKERALRSWQLRGEHALGFAHIEWKASLGKNTQAEPDLRFFSSVQNIRESASGTDTTFSLGGGNALPPQRYFRDLAEDNRGGILDVSIPFVQWGGLGSRIKFGARIDDAERAFRQRRFEYDEGRNISFSDFGGDPVAYFDNANVGVLDTLHVGTITAYNAGLYIRENSPARANYDATRTIRAGYLMLELPVSRAVKVIGGARLESTEIITESLDELLPNELRRGILERTDLLPSLNVVFALSSTMNLRAAATRTLARPTFRELAPFQSFNFVGGDIQEGNMFLYRTLITNFDARWEWFIRPGEIFAVSGFWKNFDQPIERVLRTVGEGRFISFQNVDHARILGAEFEARKRLDSWTSNPLLDKMTIGGNFSLVKSAVDIPSEELVIIRASDPNAATTRSLEGQSPFLLNLNASYENHTSGTVLSAFYNLFGSRLLVVTEGATPDVFEKSRADLDVTIAQDLPRNLRLKVTAKNVLGSDFRQIQTFKGVEYDYIAYSRSRTFSVGISYVID